MFNTILRWFGFGNSEPEILTTENYYAGARRELTINQKRYYRRGNKFYIRKHSGFDFDVDDEIVDLVLLELLMMEYDAGNIDSYEKIDDTPDEEIISILDVDINTIPVVDTVSMVDTPAQVEVVEVIPEPEPEPAETFHEELTTPQPTYTAPEPAPVPEPTYSEPERSSSYSSAGSSYSSGSSDYSSSSSDSSSSCDSSCD